MAKNATINLRVNSDARDKAKDILASLGLTLSDAFNLMIYQVGIVRGLPFEIKQRLPLELNDGHGSYICEYGHLHDYSKFNPVIAESDLAGPFKTFDEYKAWLEADDDEE
jgi:addiction module RelB/DinJ family antitoxin